MGNFCDIAELYSKEELRQKFKQYKFEPTDEQKIIIKYLEAHNIDLRYYQSDFEKERAINFIDLCFRIYKCKIEGNLVNPKDYPDLRVRYSGAYGGSFDFCRSALDFDYFKFFIENAKDLEFLNILQAGLNCRTINGKYLSNIIEIQKEKITKGQWSKPEIIIQIGEHW